MSTFAARMLEAKQVKMDRRNRGESIGNHGIRPLTKRERAEAYPLDDLEFGIVRIVQAIADVQRGFAEDIGLIVLSMNDPRYDEIPF